MDNGECIGDIEWPNELHSNIEFEIHYNIIKMQFKFSISKGI